MAEEQQSGSGRFAAVLGETQHHVRAYIAGLGVPLADVDDIAQDVYLAYYRRMDTLSADLLPIRWLKGTARNLSMNYFRRMKRGAERHQRIAELGDVESQEGTSDLNRDEETIAALLACIDKLTPRSRKLVALRYEQGSSSASAAARMGMTPGAVRVGLLRAREVLRDCIATRLRRVGT